MLHTISCCPFEGCLAALMRYVAAEDAIILMQDGVISGLAHTDNAAQLIASGAALYALHSDLVARGLLQHLAVQIVSIDYSRFVELTVQHTPQLAW